MSAAANTVGGAAGDVVQAVVAVKNREGPTRLQGDDVAQLKIPHRPALRRNRCKVGHQPMAAILVGVCAFRGIVELVDRQVDESREVAIVDGVGICVIGGQVEILPTLHHGQRSAMVNGVGNVVVVVLEPALMVCRPEPSAPPKNGPKPAIAPVPKGRRSGARRERTVRR